MKISQSYIYTGTNYKNGYTTARCGEIHTLGNWLKILFSGKNAKEYFDGWKNKEVIDYIYQVCGKGLEVFKK